VSGLSKKRIEALGRMDGGEGGEGGGGGGGVEGCRHAA
jgi:hypothetical protein